MLLLGWLFVAYDARAAWDALLSTNLSALAAVWLCAILSAWLVDAGTLTVLFARLNTRLPYLDLLRIKGASYLLNIVNYAAASGGIAWLVHRRSHAPVFETVSSVLFLDVLDLLMLNITVTAGLLLGSEFLPGALFGALVWVNIAIYALYFGSMIYWNAGFDFFVLGRLRTWPIFAAFGRATVRIHAELLFTRVVLMAVYVPMQYAALHLFGVDVPLGPLMIFNAIITLVGIIPISIAGIGTTQVVMMEVYAPYGTEAEILAYSTAGIFATLLVRSAIGVPSLASIQRNAAS